MRRILFFCMSIWMLISCTQELVYDGNHSSEWESYTVHLTQAGTLTDLLPENYLEIKSLNVAGPINGSDLKVIRRMCGADEYGNETVGETERLNLEQAVFVEGGEPYFYYDGEPILQRNQALSRYAFGYCKKLKEILLPENLEAVGSQAFYECVSIEQLVIPENVRIVSRSAFCGCSNLISIRLPESIQDLDDFLFYKCSQLEEVFLSDQIKSVGYGTFWGCRNLEGLEALCRETLESFDAYAFAGTPLVAFEIPATMHVIPDYAFSDCSGLRTVFWHEGIDSVMAGAFYHTSLSGDLVLPKSLSFVGQEAFARTEIKTLTVQSDIKCETPDLLNAGAFQSCDNLEEVTLTEGCTFLELEFSHSDALRSLKLPESLRRIGFDGTLFEDEASYLFSGCTALTELVLPDSLQYIASGMFSGTSIKEIRFPKNLEYIGINAFAECFNLEQVEMNRILKEVSYGLFSGCPALKTVIWPEQIEIIGSRAFEQCNCLKDVRFPISLVKIDSYAFKGCTSFTKIEIPANVQEIGTEAFGECRGVSQVVFEGALEQIPEGCFSSCSALEMVEWPENLIKIGAYAFSNCGVWNQLDIPNGVVDIGPYAFHNNRNLERVRLPLSVQTIGANCFQDCIHLERFEVQWKFPITISRTVFEGVVLAGVVLYVPMGTSADYCEMEVWNKFEDIREL